MCLIHKVGAKSMLPVFCLWLYLCTFVNAVMSSRPENPKRVFNAHHQAANLSLPSNLIPIPLYRQQTGYSCGPSSALSILRYWDWRRYEHVMEQVFHANDVLSFDV
jgi:hypothetical protein